MIKTHTEVTVECDTCHATLSCGPYADSFYLPQVREELISLGWTIVNETGRGPHYCAVCSMDKIHE